MHQDIYIHILLGQWPVYIISNRFAPYHITCHVMFYHIIFYMIWYDNDGITPHHITSYHIIHIIISYFVSLYIMHFVNLLLKHIDHRMYSNGDLVTLPYLQKIDYMTSLLASQINTQPPSLTTRISPQSCHFSRCVITTQVRLNLRCCWTAHNPLRSASWSSQYQMYRRPN